MSTDTTDIPEVTFDELGLADELLEAIRDAGFKTPTAIQAQSIPPALTGKDIVGAARTGSGKTAAFVLPILQLFLKNPKTVESKRPRALILSPTRELTLQIETTIQELSRHTTTTVASVVGGVNIRRQIDALSNGAEIVAATPGRLIDHMERRSIDLRAVEFFVLDEADRMLDMGFEEQLNAIMRAVPKNKQTMLFSATIHGAVDRLFRTSVKEHVQVDVTGDEDDVPDVDLRWVELMEQDKRKHLVELIENESGTLLIFCSTKQKTHLTAVALKRSGHEVAELHSGLDQRQRSKALNAFREGKIRILVATDVAARGIDVDGIAHVVNYDMPYSPEDFVHRIGRTARAGRKGNATNFVTVGDRETVKQVLRYLESKVAKEEEAEPPKPTYGRRMKRDKKARRGAPTTGRKLF